MAWHTEIGVCGPNVAFPSTCSSQLGAEDYKVPSGRDIPASRPFESSNEGLLRCDWMWSCCPARIRRRPFWARKPRESLFLGFKEVKKAV